MENTSTKGKRKYKKKRRTKRAKNACSPYAKNNKIVANSCFTENAVNTLTNAYNKHNPRNSIPLDKSAKDKWLDLQQKMSRIPKCDQDECWIQNIPLTDREKAILKARLFVPPRPHEWKKDPNTWLTNFDIENVLNQYETAYPQFRFIGPSAIDYDYQDKNRQFVCNNLQHFSVEKQLQKKQPKTGIVFNLDPHNKSGSHWVSMFIDLEDNFMFYFNSTSEPIPRQIKKFVNKVKKQCQGLNRNIEFLENTHTEHQMSNTECGMYSLYFIITMLLREKEAAAGRRGGGKRMSKQELFDLFQGKSSGRIKDKSMEKLRNVLYRGGTHS